MTENRLIGKTTQELAAAAACHRHFIDETMSLYKDEVGNNCNLQRIQIYLQQNEAYWKHRVELERPLLDRIKDLLDSEDGEELVQAFERKP